MALAGTVVAEHYRMVRPLGRGISSVVYLAVSSWGKPCAVKLFKPGLAFRAAHEADILQRLRTPEGTANRVPELLATGEVIDDGERRAALVLSLLRGKVLFERYRSRPAMVYEPMAFWRTMEDLTGALVLLHERGLLHRDIKAENAIVSPAGEATLIDFDLSGPIHQDFQAPIRIGTEAYLAPEAARGESLGTESDLYSLGVLLYWGLHGELPHGEAAPCQNERCKLAHALLQPERHARPDDAAWVCERFRELSP